MEKSEQINELAKALVEAQKELKHAPKDSQNPFFKSGYASLASVLDSCRGVLNQHGISVLQLTQIVGDRTCVVTTLLHASGQWISGELPLNPVKNDPQSVGSAISYARRYALQAIVGMATEDDDGDHATKPQVHTSGYVHIPNRSVTPTESGIRSDFAPPPEDDRAAFELARSARYEGEYGFDSIDAYRVPFGKKYKGQTLKEMGVQAVQEFSEYLQSSSAQENKPLSLNAAEFVKKAETFLAANRDIRTQ